MNIVQPSIADVLWFGNRQATDLRNLIWLVGVLSSGSNIYTSFRRTSASAGYKPVGKTFKVIGARAVNGSSTANSRVMLGYNDVDLGMAGTTAPTNPVWMGATKQASAILQVPFTSSTNASANADGLVPDFVCADGKYLFAEVSNQDSSLSVWLAGYEVS